MENNIFHITNRGVDKREIFLEDMDRLRFVSSLYAFNNRGFSLFRKTKLDIFKEQPTQDKLVTILKWALMDNHYHLLLQELFPGGAVEFVKRLGNGYTKYFNIKNSRSGYLFQNSAKIILIENHRHFIHIPFYIDLNPIKIIMQEGVKRPASLPKLLACYIWSSFSDYEGKTNFPGLVDTSLFYSLFNTTQAQYNKDLITTWQVEQHVSLSEQKIL